MRSLILLFCLVFIVNVYAGVPFNIETENRFSALETLNTQTTESNINKQHARFVWNYTDTATPVNTWDSGVNLPANSVVEKVWGFVATQVTSTTDNTIALGCGASGAEFFQATDLTDTASGSFIANFDTPVISGNTFDSGSMTYNLANCDLTVNIGSGASGTATGKIIWDVEYYVAE